MQRSSLGALARPASPAARRTNPNVVLAVMALAVAMVVAAVNMLANALAHLAGDLQASQSEQQWIVDAYALALAALLLPAGAIGDRYGRRGALVIGVAVFGGASGLAAFASSPAQLIALRALMGAGAAALMPGTLSTITSIYPPEGRAKAVGIWAGAATIGANLGMLASGALLETFYWGSIFIATAGLAAVLLVAILVAVPSTKAEEHVPMDPIGAVLSGLGIGAFVLGIIEGPVRGWFEPVTLVALIGGAALLVAFVLAELRSHAPVLDPRLFRHRGFATGSVSLFLQFFAMFGFFFVAVQFLQLVLEYSALTAAVALLPMAVLIIPLATFAGTLAERYGHNRVGGLGLAISAVGLAYFATLDPGSSYWPFLGATLLIGLGAPLALTPATTAIVASLPREKQGVASAVNDLAREIGAAFGIAVLGSAFNTGYRGRIDDDLAGRPADLADRAREAPAIALREAHDLNDSALATSARDAFTSGMRYAVGLGALLLVVGAVYVWARGASATATASSGGDPDDRELLDADVDFFERDLDDLDGRGLLVPPVRDLA
jgi:EmrB/QacA subfamily drug resistance transporter